jgi:hypothetical protein
MKARILVSICLCLAALIPAQSPQVLPQAFTTKEGTGVTNLPFGRAVPLRVQMAYGQSLFSQARTILGVGFRPEPGRSAAAKIVELQVHAGTLAGEVTSIRAPFAQNRGPDFVEVFKRRKLSLPAFKASTSLSGFQIQIPFDSSFIYDPSKGSLLLETVVHGQPRGSYQLDATYLCESPLLNLGPQGCGAPGGKALGLDSETPQVMWSRPANLRVVNARPQALTLLLLGSRSQGTWNGITLPLELSSVGAPGCHLAVDILAAPGLAADQSGVATYRFLVPTQPQLRGVSVVVQGVAQDAKANALGLVSSHAARILVCGWEPVSRVFANGLSVTTGFRELGVAPVMQLTSR